MKRKEALWSSSFASVQVRTCSEASQRRRGRLWHVPQVLNLVITCLRCGGVDVGTTVRNSYLDDEAIMARIRCLSAKISSKYSRQQSQQRAYKPLRMTQKPCKPNPRTSTCTLHTASKHEPYLIVARLIEQPSTKMLHEPWHKPKYQSCMRPARAVCKPLCTHSIYLVFALPSTY